MGNHFYRLVLFVVCVQGESFSQGSLPVDRISDELVGPVKSVEWTIQDIEAGKDVTSWQNSRLWKKVSYDRTGNKIQEDYYGEEGYSRSTITYPDRVPGKTAVRENLSSNGEKTFFYRQFDTKGKVVNERYTKADGQIIRQWIYTWDEKAKKDDVSIYGSDGKLESRAEWYYDSQFRVIRKRDVPNPKLEVLYEYGDDGHLRRKEQIQYQEEKRWITVSENGRDTESETRSIDGTLLDRQAYRYKFDDRGNWIEQTKIFHSLPGRETFESERHKVIRAIEYY